MVGGGGAVPSASTKMSSYVVPVFAPPALPLFRIIVATSPEATNDPTFATGEVSFMDPDQPPALVHVSFL